MHLSYLVLSFMHLLYLHNHDITAVVPGHPYTLQCQYFYILSWLFILIHCQYFYILSWLFFHIDLLCALFYHVASNGFFMYLYCFV